MVKSSWPVTVFNDMGLYGTGRGWSEVTMPKLIVKGERMVEILQRKTSKNIWGRNNREKVICGERWWVLFGSFWCTEARKDTEPGAHVLAGYGDEQAICSRRVDKPMEVWELPEGNPQAGYRRWTFRVRDKKKSQLWGQGEVEAEAFSVMGVIEGGHFIKVCFQTTGRSAKAKDKSNFGWCKFRRVEEKRGSDRKFWSISRWCGHGNTGCEPLFQKV